MQTYELVMIALIGTTLFIGLSAALYSALPAAALDYGSRHGRYVGLGKPDRLDDFTAGNAPITAVAGLQGQSA
jgi:hypothetical protein